MKVLEHINTLKYNTGNSFAIASVTNYLVSYLASVEFNYTIKNKGFVETCLCPNTTEKCQIRYIDNKVSTCTKVLPWGI